MGRIAWPRSGTHKVVQIYLDDRPELVFGPDRGMYHSDILRDFLNAAGINFRIVLNERGHLAPALAGEEYRVPGMGKVEVDTGIRRSTFYGKGRCYELGIDRPHLMRLVNRHWGIYLDRERLE